MSRFLQCGRDGEGKFEVSKRVFKELFIYIGSIDLKDQRRNHIEILKRGICDAKMGQTAASLSCLPLLPHHATHFRTHNKSID